MEMFFGFANREHIVILISLSVKWAVLWIIDYRESVSKMSLA